MYTHTIYPVDPNLFYIPRKYTASFRPRGVLMVLLVIGSLRRLGFRIIRLTDCLLRIRETRYNTHVNKRRIYGAGRSMAAVLLFHAPLLSCDSEFVKA